MTIISVEAAQTDLSSLVARVEAGEEIVLVRDDTPVAKLVPLSRSASRRRFGALRGVVSVGPEFFAPLPETELANWE